MEVSNLSNLSVDLHYGRDEDLAKWEISVQAVIFFLAVFGNGLVVVLLSCHKKKLSRMNLLILHLAIADLFVAIFNILPQLIWDITFRFQGDRYLCKAVKYFQVFIFDLREVSPGSAVLDCWADFRPEWTLQFYITWFTSAVYIIPLLLLAFFYGRICYVVWKSMRQSEAPQGNVKYQRVSGNCSGGAKPQGGELWPPRRHVRTLSKSKMKTVKLTLTVVLCYLLCWAPFFVAQMWSAWDERAPFEADAMAIILLLASLNSCTNPWIYFVFANISEHWRRMCGRRGSSSSMGSKSYRASVTDYQQRSNDFSLTYENTYSTRVYGTVRSSAFAMKPLRGNGRGDFV